LNRKKTKYLNLS